MTTPQPVWGADCPISMPPPAGEDTVLELGGGFAMTQFRLVHSITGREYEQMAVPVWAPVTGDEPEIRGDAGIDAAGGG